MKCESKIQISGLSLEWQTHRGTCTLENLPMVGMWINTTLAALMSGLQTMVGTDRFNLALQSLGRQSVEDDWQFISQYSDFPTGFAALNRVAVAAGWGIWELVSLDWQKQVSRFRIKNTWEGGYQKTLGVCWGSNFVAGKLAGYCSKLFDTNCWAEQTAFIARGDEFDEFVVQPSVRSLEEEIDKLLETDEATRADMAVALKKWQQEAMERQKAQEIWRQSEERYRSLVVATSQIVWTTDPQGQVIDIPGWREYTGQTQTEVKGWGWIDAVHPDDREDTMQIWFRALETKSLYETEYRIREKNGNYRYFAARGVPVLTADGQVREWIGTCTDIEERKQAEEQLIRYQEQLADLVLERTSELAKTNGKLKEKIKQLQQAESERSIALAQEQAARTRAEALLQERDATLKRLRESEERYRSLVVATSQIVWITNAEGLEPNMPTWLAYTGQTEAETQNWGWLDAIHPQDRDRAARDWYLAVNTKSLYDTEYRLKGADGIYRYFAVRGVPVIDVTDSIREWVGVCTDIHDRKLAEEALRQSELRERERSAALEQTLHKLQSTQAQLIQSEKMSSLGQLVAGVAHEINNPVNFIYGNLNYASQYAEEIMELLQLYHRHYPQPKSEIQQLVEQIDFDFLIEDFPRLLSSIKVGAERIREIVLSLRNFSRLDEAEMKKVNIHEGIDSTLMILQNRLKFKNQHKPIEIIKEYGNLPPVECYPGQLNQVFMNLITNAIDALETCTHTNLPTLEDYHPIVRIRTEVNNSIVKIIIIDNGPGMKSEIIPRLFDPFFTTKPVGKGTGLGLSISYQIVVEKHGGSLKCISEVGKGAEFVIEIPLRQSC